MKTLAVLPAVIGLLIGTVAWVGAEELAVKGVHRGAGIAVSVSSSKITLIEGNELHRMAIDGNTRILIGPELRVSTLGTGGYVAEECVPDGKGGLTAVRLILYRPAWMENASPES